MSKNVQDTGLPEPMAIYEQMMGSWVQAWMAATDQCFKMWMLPFAPPLPDEVETAGDLDIPGPLERDHEHNLFA